MTDARAAGGGIPGGNRGIDRLRTRGVREIGGLEGPGSGRSSGLPPRALFFAKSKTNGVRKRSGPQKLLRFDPFCSCFQVLFKKYKSIKLRVFHVYKRKINKFRSFFYFYFLSIIYFGYD